MAFIIHSADATVIISLLTIALAVPEAGIAAFITLFFYQQLRSFALFYLESKTSKQTNDLVFGLFELISILGCGLACLTASLTVPQVVFFTALFGLTTVSKFTWLSSLTETANQTSNQSRENQIPLTD